MPRIQEGEPVSRSPTQRRQGGKNSDVMSRMSPKEKRGDAQRAGQGVPEGDTDRH